MNDTNFILLVFLFSLLCYAKTQTYKLSQPSSTWAKALMPINIKQKNHKIQVPTRRNEFKERKKRHSCTQWIREYYGFIIHWMHKTMWTRKFKFSIINQIAKSMLLRCIHINRPIYRSVPFNMPLSKQGTSNSMLYLLRDRTMNCIPGTRFTHAASFSLTMLSANFLPTQRFPRY